MPIKKIPNSYLNNNAVFTPTRTVGEKVNEIIENYNELLIVVDDLQEEVSSGEFENITVTNTGTISNIISDGESTFASVQVTDFLVTDNISLSSKGNITQSGSISTTVTLPTPINYNSGLITTVSATIAAGASATFNVGSALLYSSSRTVILSLQYGGAGTPYITWARTLPDTVAIKITNLHPSDALDNILRIHYIAL